MAIKDAYIAEIKQEAILTKKILERVPMERKDWKPDDKSMSVGRLATHIAHTIKWASNIVTKDDFDFGRDMNFDPDTAGTTEELMTVFQTNLDNAIADISKLSDEDFDKLWTARAGEQVFYTLPKKVAVRGFSISHMIHHRGQLSVYLRLLGVPVPGMYGPSADER